MRFYLLKYGTALLRIMDNYWKDKKVLVTGGTGFLGKHLVDDLVKREAIVSVVDFRKPSFDIEASLSRRLTSGIKKR